MTSKVPLQFLHAVPYSDPPSRLRTVDIWLPPHNEQGSSHLPWVVYVHGGAWRDPMNNATENMNPTVHHLTSSHPSTLSQIGGIASLNYRLSPYPNHKTDPSDASDPDRNARHPQHVRDMAQGLHFLQRKYNIKRWIGIGHSCGATMLCHLLGGLLGLAAPSHKASTIIIKPEAVLFLAGIFDFPLMLQNHAPPACTEEFSKMYDTFFASAFGEDRSVWQRVSPVCMKLDEAQWPEGKLVMIAYSYDDELVEAEQREAMSVALQRQGWTLVKEEEAKDNVVRGPGRRVLDWRDIKGHHCFIWQDGQQLASLITEVVQRLD